MLKKPHLGISGGLFCDLFSLLSSRFSLRSSLFSLLSSLSSRLSSLIPLCFLPSSLFSLCSLPSSLAAAHFSDPTSHLSLRTSHQAIHYASNPLDPVPHHPFALSSAHLSDRTSHFSLRSSNHCVLRPCHLDRACLPLLASLFALPSSLLGADPFLCHPALLGPNHCLQTLLSVSCCCSKNLMWGSLAAFLVISSLFSLLSALFSLFSRLSPPVSLLSSLSALFPLLSSRSALFPLLLLLVSSQTAIRTSHCELCITGCRLDLTVLRPYPYAGGG